MAQPRRRRVASALCLSAALAAGGCDETFDILNTNAPTVEEVVGNPSRATLSRTATGIFAQLTPPGIVNFAILGREGYNLSGNDPRFTGELITGPLDPRGFGASIWGAWSPVRTIHTYLKAVDNTPGLSPAEKQASKGFARTLKAWQMYWMIVRSGDLGIPVDLDRPIGAEPAPFVSKADAYAYVMNELETAFADLTAAGGTAFPFTVAPGFEIATTPATFARLNRALAARVLVSRATHGGCGNSCFTQALAALSGSFITTAALPGTLTTGVYYAYSTAAGERTNTIGENPNGKVYWVHPSLETGAQKQANNSLDQRFINKTRKVAPPGRMLNGLWSDLKPAMYGTPDLGADIPLIRNEELILLRAEANLALGNRQAALDDINLIRVNSGKLPNSSLTAASAPADILTELLYNRLYSLLWEQGTRWFDAVRYNRKGTIPIDRTGDVVFDNLVLPGAECDARKLPAPCDPLASGR